MRKAISIAVYATGPTKGYTRERENQRMIKTAIMVTVLSKLSRMKTITGLEAIAVVTISTMECASRSTNDAHHL